MGRKIKHNAVLEAVTTSASNNEQLDDMSKAKLEQYDKLIAENDKLHSQIEYYVQENISLKDQIKNLQEQSSSSIDGEKLEFQQKIDKLQEENDSYLLKISELSFELAKTQSELENAKNAINHHSPPKKVNHVHSNMDMYPRNNGYDHWN